MKLVLATLLVVCLAFVLAAGAYAGDYHSGTKLKCYQCHVMHATKSHLYTEDTHDEWSGSVNGGAGYGKLLKEDDVNALCFECHDGADTIDVYGDVTQGGQPAHRSGGQFNGLDTAAYTAPMVSALGHNLGNEGDIPPGSGGAEMKLDCGSCHDVHGNTYYRNLNPVAGAGITYAKTTNDPTKDVFEALPWSANPVADAYDAANISYNTPAAGAASNVEQFCVSCHGDIHSDTEGTDGWTKHPTIGRDATWRAGSLSKVKTLGEQVSCVSCHKAHGSTHSFGLVYDDRTTATIEDGVNIMATCQQCHDKGV